MGTVSMVDRSLSQCSHSGSRLTVLTVLTPGGPYSRLRFKMDAATSFGSGCTLWLALTPGMEGALSCGLKLLLTWWAWVLSYGPWQTISLVVRGPPGWDDVSYLKQAERWLRRCYRSWGVGDGFIIPVHLIVDLGMSSTSSSSVRPFCESSYFYSFEGRLFCHVLGVLVNMHEVLIQKTFEKSNSNSQSIVRQLKNKIIIIIK